MRMRRLPHPDAGGGRVETVTGAKPDGEGQEAPAPWRLEVGPPAGGALPVRLAGRWQMDARLPGAEEVARRAAGMAGIRRVTLDGAAIARWDSALLTFLAGVMAENARRQIDTELTGFPAGVERLLRLASAAPRRPDTAGAPGRPGWLARAGLAALGAWQEVLTALAFLGEVCRILPRLLRGRARFRRADFALLLQECGAAALPIVTLISFLVGVILAYVGAMQLRTFGAQIFVADLVGIAMAREMGAMMTAIIMAGRTGAAFAAELGSMQANEELDALGTLGIPPMEFLVLPRILALALMMPLLTIYADLVGILGGAAIGVTMLDLGAVQYALRTIEAVAIQDAAAGLLKGSVFGVLVAVAGCLRGMTCGRSAPAVGWATTSAVVTGIVSIIVSDAALTVIFDLLGL
jgi:phospholipid/cholesterol/gamma-HCH transport system permease protein